MKKYKIFMMLALLCTFATGCKDSENVYNEDERAAYDAAFTQTFGAVSQKQEWNVCRRASLSVETPVDIDTLKVYALANNEYRLTASMPLTAGKHVINFDAPKGYDDVIVKADNMIFEALIDGKLVIDKAFQTVDADLSARISDRPLLWVIAVEGWEGVRDFDFNDVVIGVTHLSGESFCRIYPLAIGSEYHTWVYLDGQQIEDEWHRQFDTSWLHLTNTYKLPDELPAPIVSAVSADWSLAFDSGVSNMGNISVVFRRGYDNPQGESGYKYQDAVPPLKTGVIPHMLLVCGDWWWPRESYNIGADCYKRTFESWLKGETSNNSLWYEHRNADQQRVIDWDTNLLLF